MDAMVPSVRATILIIFFCSGWMKGGAWGGEERECQQKRNTGDADGNVNVYEKTKRCVRVCVVCERRGWREKRTCKAKG